MLLLHECDRAVTMAADGQYLVMHRNELTDYRPTGLGLSEAGGRADA